MESGGRTTSSARGGRSGRGKSARSAGKGSKRGNAPGIAPLYKRLPHGPHRLARDEVIHNQRARIHGAMIEAVSTVGYEATSVKQVIALAGVSRRSFYEQFANKQVAFLATFDMLARRELQHLRQTYLSAGGDLENRVRASLARFARMTDEDRKAAIVVVLETQTAGLEGASRLRRAMNMCEQMLVQSFAQTEGAVALPTPIVRCILGGLKGIAGTALRASAAERPANADVAAEMLDWTLTFQSAAVDRMSERLTAELAVRIREIASQYGHGQAGAEAPSRDERTRLQQGLLRLVTREEYRSLSAPQIADEANVAIERFCELYEDKDDCFLAALDTIGDELLTIAADPKLVCEDDWAHAVRRVLAELMRYLADHPLQTRILVQEGFFAGAEACERLYEISHGIATLLTEGAPSPARGRMIPEAVAGAIWHTVRCQVSAGRIPLLAALSDHLAYVVIAPYLGADAAAEILTQERVPVSRVGACETSVPRNK